jgi:hypothetical protein
MRRRIAHAAQIGALVLALALVPAALAAKGGGGPKGGGGTSGSSSIKLAPLVVDRNSDGLTNFLDVVTFNVSTTATTEPYVNLLCYQNGVLVLNGWQGYFDGALNSSRDFGLGSGAWQSGAADCTAYLVMYNTRHGWSRLTSTSFHVNG